jgi:hypothetical protein
MEQLGLLLATEYAAYVFCLTPYIKAPEDFQQKVTDFIVNNWDSQKAKYYLNNELEMIPAKPLREIVRIFHEAIFYANFKNINQRPETKGVHKKVLRVAKR